MVDRMHSAFHTVSGFIQMCIRDRNMMMRGIGDRGFGEGDGDGESMPDFGSGNGSRNRRSYRADGQMPGMQDSDGANGESNGDARNRSQSNDSDSNADSGSSDSSKN